MGLPSLTALTRYLHLKVPWRLGFLWGKKSPPPNLRSKRHHGKGLLETAHPQMVGLELKALWHQPSRKTKKTHADLAVVDDKNYKLMFFLGERGRGFGSYMKENNSWTEGTRLKNSKHVRITDAWYSGDETCILKNRNIWSILSYGAGWTPCLRPL